MDSRQHQSLNDISPHGTVPLLHFNRLRPLRSATVFPSDLQNQLDLCELRSHWRVNPGRSVGRTAAIIAH